MAPAGSFAELPSDPPEPLETFANLLIEGLTPEKNPTAAPEKKPLRSTYPESMQATIAVRQMAAETLAGIPAEEIDQVWPSIKSTLSRVTAALEAAPKTLIGSRELQFHETLISKASILAAAYRLKDKSIPHISSSGPNLHLPE